MEALTQKSTVTRDLQGQLDGRDARRLRAYIYASSHSRRGLRCAAHQGSRPGCQIGSLDAQSIHPRHGAQGRPLQRLTTTRRTLPLSRKRETDRNRGRAFSGSFKNLYRSQLTSVIPEALSQAAPATTTPVTEAKNITLVAVTMASSPATSTTERTLLGAGGYGQVYREGNKAVKVSKCENERQRTSVRREFKLMSKGSRYSANILRAEKLTFLDDSKTAEIRMPLCAGSLRIFMHLHRQREAERTGRKGCGLPERFVAHVAQQMLMALCVLHGLGYVHGDIKPDNILLTSFPEDPEKQRLEKGAMKLADFGVSYAWREGALVDRMVGTTVYAAPEVREAKKPREERQLANLGPASDLWSLGITLMELILGHRPVNLEDMDVENGAAWKGVSEKTKTLISRLTSWEARDRLTAMDHLKSEAIVFHPFLEEYDEDEEEGERGDTLERTAVHEGGEASATQGQSGKPKGTSIFRSRWWRAPLSNLFMWRRSARVAPVV